MIRLLSIQASLSIIRTVTHNILITAILKLWKPSVFRYSAITTQSLKGEGTTFFLYSTEKLIIFRSVSLRTHRIQPLSPLSTPDKLDLYGIVRITPGEARLGTRKMISLPHGLKKGVLMVTIPPGVQEGRWLRLKGLRKQGNGGEGGDLFLDVHLID